MDMLRRRGWQVKGVLNQSKALNRTRFVNKTAELWFKFSRLIEEGILRMPEPEDSKFETQLVERHWLENSVEKEKLQLERKQDARRKGRQSPDRADAAVLAFFDLQLRDFLSELDKQVEAALERKRNRVSVKDFLVNRDDVRYGHAEPRRPKQSATKIFNFHNLTENNDVYQISSSNKKHF
jgi:hypothetical protein